MEVISLPAYKIESLSTKWEQKGKEKKCLYKW